MAEGGDPKPSIGSIRSAPKDLQVMANILSEMGVDDYEPRVLNQMLEYSYRYLTTMLEDAHSYSLHAKKKVIDSDDVKLAISLYQDRIDSGPPSRDVIAEVAQLRNSLPLPQIKTTAGLRLPPDRHSLTSSNYRLKPTKKKAHAREPRSNVSSTSSSPNLGNKNAALANVNKTPPKTPPKSSPNKSPSVTKPTPSISKPVSPYIKFPNGKEVSSSTGSPTLPAVITPVNYASQVLMPTADVSSTSDDLMLMPPHNITSASQHMMPSTSANQHMMPSTSGINMPTVSSMNTDLKGEFEDDDDYDMD